MSKSWAGPKSLAGGASVSSKSVAPDPVGTLDFRRPSYPGRSDGHSAGTTFSDEGDVSTFKRIARAIGAPVVGVSAVLLITEIYRHVPLANETTVGFTFLLAILVASTIGGLRTAIPMSVAATLALDYYFIPPINTWNITDPQDWVALSAFTVSSVVGSTLSAWARRQTKEAHRQRTEAEQLYDLSQRLLSAGDSLALCNAIPSDIVSAFRARAAALLLTDGQTIFFSPGGLHQIDATLLKSSLGNKDVQVESDKGLSFVPLRMGINVIGGIAIAETTFSLATLESLGSLVTIAIERARAIEQVGKIEALRENERLKSALLDAITHEFRTPLTAMKISVTGMLSDLNFDRAQCRDLLTMIDEGCDRIDHLVDEVSQMSRIESGETQLDFKRHSVGELIEAALNDCDGVLGPRPIERGIANEAVAIRADLFWATKVLVHLISNANLYSSPGAPITVRTETKHGLVFFSVADRGPGINQNELGRIFEKFYRGEEHRCRVQGTGMGLPISKAIVEAHAGTIGATSKVGEGSVFYFSLPIDRSSEVGE
jgi:two-component system, OmpR family, sensor histidine kinase KdpD